jgi:exosortase A-associated hydrolase 1
VVTATAEERAVVFECEGEQLLGVVSPASGAGTLGLLILVGGPQYRVGSHRQFLLLARRLADLNIPVMRFDFRGMGDSAGEVHSFEDVVPDIAAAIGAFKTAVPSVEKIVLWGLCDAASESLLYWHDTHDPRVAGMVLADPWITSHGEFAKSQLQHYIARPFQREFWKKLFSGGIDLGGAMRDVFAVISKTRESSAPSSTARMSFQEKMTRGMDSFASPVLLLLSGDLTARDFLRHCETHPQWQRLIEKPNVTRAHLPDANHTFASAAARGQVEDLTIDWLRRELAR